MKKYIALILALAMVMAFAGCGAKEEPAATTEASATETTAAATETAAAETEAAAAETTAATEAAETAVAAAVMTHEEFVAAELDSQVTVETYVQAKQGWWDNKATLYTQAEDGAYFIYDMPCTEEEYAKLTEGTKIRVTGYKAEWEGEVEIIDATYEILEGNFVAEPVDVTELMADEAALIAHQNEKVAVKGLTVEKVEYKNGEPGDDIYVTLGLNGASYTFCVEFYLTGADTEVYKTVGELKEGDVVDVEAFLYWYAGPNAHLTQVTVQ